MVHIEDWSNENSWKLYHFYRNCWDSDRLTCSCNLDFLLPPLKFKSQADSTILLDLLSMSNLFHLVIHVPGFRKWDILCNFNGRPENWILCWSAWKPSVHFNNIKRTEGSWYLLLQWWFFSKCYKRRCCKCNWYIFPTYFCPYQKLISKKSHFLQDCHPNILSGTLFS